MTSPRVALAAAVVVLLSAGLSGLAGCNVFDPFDNPGGDAQLLSAARACFDQGKIACARENYAKLSSSYSEVAASETAFAILAENGVDFAVFMGAFGGGDGGTGLTAIANALIANAGVKQRLAIFEAYKQIANITTNKELRGLVRFAVGVALAGEILAEAANSDGKAAFSQSDLVKDAKTCAKSAGACDIAGDTACDAPSGSRLETGSTSIVFTDTDVTNSTKLGADKPTLFMLDAAIDEISTALGASELGAGGDFKAGAASFADAVGVKGPQLNGGQCYRSLLVAQGVGE